MTESYTNLFSTQNSIAQQTQLNFEPHRLHHSGQTMGDAQFALCTKSAGGKINQQLFPLRRLDWAVQQLAKTPQRFDLHTWISQATLAPWATNRRINSILSLNAVWVDIDLMHPHKSFDTACMPTLSTPEKMAQLLLVMIQDANLPLPTCIVWTGGGLCPKWIFDAPLPAIARARWQSLETEIVKKVGELSWDFGEKIIRWPVDHGACDAARILRLPGSHNPRWGQDCRVVWDSDVRHNFDELADEVLQYTREEVRAFRSTKAAAKQFDENRSAASDLGIRVQTHAGKTLKLADEAARGLWTRRVEFMKAVLTERGGVQAGSRNNIFWPAANALAWSCMQQEQVVQELAALHHAFFRHASWSRGEAMQSASSVLRKLKSGESYKMTTGTFLSTLEVTSSELIAHGELLGTSRHNATKKSCDVGVMGFEPMCGLSLGEYVAETKKRQSLAGMRSIEIRKPRADAHDTCLHVQAKSMAANGVSTRQIALDLSVNQSTVVRWLK